MRRIHKAFAIIIAISLVFSLCLPLMPRVAAAASQGRITGDSVRMRDKATTSGSNIVATLSLGAVVTINGKVSGQEAVSGSGTTWYNVTSGGKTGYVYGKYVEEIAPPTYNEDFESNLLSFPEDYRAALRAIHNAYPNWVFIADKISLSFDDAVELQYGDETETMGVTRKWVELSYGLRWRDPRTDEENPSHILEGRWTYASRKSIAFFMDPRNGLTVNNSQSDFPNIFTFLEHTYNASVQTEAGVRSIVANTFLANGYGGDKDAYIKDIMAAAGESGVSPYIIATTIITEQGTGGTSRLISGTYSGYEGYYNFFNYGAYGDNVIKNGLEYAKKQGWNSRRASIVGGAKKYGSGYIGIGQNTYYYMDFNVKYPDKIYHQYATALYDQCTKAAILRKALVSDTGMTLSFHIPVYTDLPYEVSAEPTEEDYYVHVCEGETINAQPATCLEDGYSGDVICKTCGELIREGSVIPATGHNYNAAVKNPTCTQGGYTTYTCSRCGDTYSDNYTDALGHNYIMRTVRLATEAESGLKEEVCSRCGLKTGKTQELPYTGHITGDINGDDSVNNKDLTRLFQYLSEWEVEINEAALDVNGDGSVNNKDLTRLFQFLSDWDVEIF